MRVLHGEQGRYYIRTTLLKTIINFQNKTNLIQYLLICILIVLFGIDLGINYSLILWLKSLLANIIKNNNANNFVLNYFIILSLSSLILIKFVFTLIAIIKYYFSFRYE
jgi:hypothetical protein